MAELEQRQGRTFTDRITATNRTGAAYDFTGMKVFWTLKDELDVSLTDALAIERLYWQPGGPNSGITIDTPTSGVAFIEVERARTALWVPGRTYRYELTTLSTADDAEVVDEGTILVLPSVLVSLTIP